MRNLDSSDTGDVAILDSREHHDTSILGRCISVIGIPNTKVHCGKLLFAVISPFIRSDPKTYNLIALKM